MTKAMQEKNFAVFASFQQITRVFPMIALSNGFLHTDETKTLKVFPTFG